MFGYVKPYPPNLLVRDHEYYRAAYCGLCRAMQKHTGLCSAFSLSYDILLLALTRMLYLEDKNTPCRARRCLAHPFKKRKMMDENPALVYAARVSALLTYYKIEDNTKDDRGFRRAGAYALLPMGRHAKRKANLAQLDQFVKDRLRALDELQKTGTASVSECAQVFGELLGRVFSFGLEGNDALVTRVFGEGIGRFIYAADAAEDYEKDARDGNFNPFVVLYGKDGLTKEQKENIHGALLMDLCHVENAMNLLPRENNDALIHIIENTVCEGLPRRIRFLLEDVCASQQN